MDILLLLIYEKRLENYCEPFLNIEEINTIQ